MPEPTVPRQCRDKRVNFDVSVGERRAMQAAAQALGLNFTSWARMILLEASRAAFRDSIQHPTLYTKDAIGEVPPVREPAPRRPMDPRPSSPAQAEQAAAPGPEADPKPEPDFGPKRFNPPPRARPNRSVNLDNDSDGIDFDQIPGARVVPGLGTVKFQ